MNSGPESIWGPRQLRAAIWVLRTIGDGRVPFNTVEESFPKLPVGGVIGLGELQSALHALLRDGIIGRDGDNLWIDLEIRPDSFLELGSEVELLGVILERTNPLWLRLASSDGVEFRPEYLPSHVEQCLHVLILDSAKREEFLLSRGRIFSSEETKRIGEEGEVLVMEELKTDLFYSGHSELAGKVIKVSEISDELGYDITAPRIDGSTRRIEVKSSANRSKSFVFYLSRNEFEVGIRDVDWSLVAVRFSELGGYVVGWVDGKALEKLVPIDRPEAGVWTATKVSIQPQFLNQGLPTAGAKGR